MNYQQRLIRQLTSLQTRVPVPDDHAIAHSEKLHAHLQSLIGAESLPFSAFMEQVLYAPGLGYYSAGATKIGDAGDFVTAPELSPLFSQCIAKQVAQVLNESGGEILEFGAGQGKMAYDILCYLDQINCLPERYGILEVSADLQQRQKATLDLLPAHLRAKVYWRTDLPDTFTGVMLANEVLDAMPATRWSWQDNSLYECAVTLTEDGEFSSTLIDPSEPLKRWFEGLPAPLRERLPNGYTSECHLAHESWLSQLATVLTQGLILLIDYGMPQAEYYLPERNDGSLLCYYRHHSHSNPLVLVGLQDITAHVDFTAVAIYGLNAGLELAGYCHQAAFLQALGILTLAQDAADLKKQLANAQALKRLLMPYEMGESFKVMALSKNCGLDLVGFSLMDQRERLG